MSNNGFFDNPYFTSRELKCKGEDGILQLAPGFLGELVWLREVFNKPMIVTSCCRTPAHNMEINGNPNSLHLTVNERWNTGGTLAIDIQTLTGDYRSDLINTARSLGWSIGHGNTFVHLDKRIQIGLPRTEFSY